MQPPEPGGMVFARTKAEVSVQVWSVVVGGCLGEQGTSPSIARDFKDVRKKEEGCWWRDGGGAGRGRGRGHRSSRRPRWRGEPRSECRQYQHSYCTFLAHFMNFYRPARLESNSWCAPGPQQHGFTSGEVKKLQDAGFFTIQSIAFATKKDLCAVKGISEAKADKLHEVGRFSIFSLVAPHRRSTFFGRPEPDLVPQ